MQLISLRGRVLHGMSWLAGTRLVSQVFTWAVTLLVIRLLEPADYGLMGLATMFVSFMLMFSSLGLGPAIVQRRTLDEGDLRDVFGASLLLNGIVIAALFLGAPVISDFFEEPRLTGVVRVLALQFLLVAFTMVPTAMLERRMHFRGWSVGNLCAQVAGSSVTLLLAWQGFGVWALVWGNLMTFTVRAIIVNYLARCLVLPALRLRRIATMLRFGGFVTMSRLLYFVSEQADYFIIGKVLGKDALGYYNVAYQLAAMPMQRTSGILNRVALPAFSELQSDALAGGRQYLKSVRLVSLFGVPFLWGVASVAPEAVPVVLGGQWEQATLPLQLVCLVIPLRMTSNLLSPAIQGFGRPKLGFFMSLRVTTVMVLAFLVGIQWGIVGVAMAWVIAWPAVYAFNLGRALPVLSLRRRDLARSLAPSWSAGALMVAAVAAVRLLLAPHLSSVVLLPILVGVGALAYATSLFLMNRTGVEEALDLLRRRS